MLVKNNNFDNFIAQRVKYTEYAIRDVAVEAEKLKKMNKKIVDFSVGDPIKNGFDVPKELKKGLCKAVYEGHNYYADPVGEYETREAIAKKEKMHNNISIDPENIIIGNGISEVFLIFSAALFDKGDEILVPNPTYPIFFTYPRFFGAKVVYYKCDESNEWQPDLEDIKRKLNKRTKAIVIVNPNNPTGSIYSKEVLIEIAKIAKEKNLMLIADEIYDHNIIEGKFYSLASIVKDWPVFGFNGISKCYFATGWRFGYMYIANPDKKTEQIKDAVAKIARMRAYTNAPIQRAAQYLMKKEPFKQKFMFEIRKRRDYFMKRLDEIADISYVRPRGAFYIFPNIGALVKNKVVKDDKDFVFSILRTHGLLFVHGSGFGPAGKNHFRSVFLPDKEKIDMCFDIMEKFLRKRSN
ncbi:MAG: aminotransferase class I/II-fold pyridoxal phosphate-dependent enzyme [Candidatus Anstonellales archaeon]